MAERKSVSMQDLADKLGISKVTVSKALNGKDGVGEELKEENPVMSFRTTENGRAKKSVSS